MFKLDYYYTTYALYALVSEVITRRFSPTKICKARNSLLFIDITKPQSLTTNTAVLHGVYSVVYISLHSAHTQNNTCYYRDSAKS